MYKVSTNMIENKKTRSTSVRLAMPGQSSDFQMVALDV